MSNVQLVNPSLLKIQKIVEQAPDMFFYVGLPLSDTRFKPFELISIYNLNNNKNAPGMIHLEHSLKEGVQLSKDMAQFLELKVNDYIKVELLYNILPLERVLIKPKLLNKSKPIPSKFKLSQLIFQRLKYCYLPDEYVVTIQGSTYQLKIKDVNRTGGQVTSSTLFYYLEDYEAKKDITGHAAIYNYLSQILEWPKYYKTEFETLKIKLPKGVILYGPPGCGKTHLLREVLKTNKWKVFNVKGPEILSKYVGGSESALRKIFETAKLEQPSIILFDQIDAIASKRDTHSEHQSKLVSQLLSCMDGLASRGSVIVIATTNVINNLDPALRRPGRFDKQIAINPPDISARRDLLNIFLDGVETKNLDLNELAHKTNGFVHADLQLLCNEAKLKVIARNLQGVSKEQSPIQLTMDDFAEAFKVVPPSLLRQYNIQVASKDNIKINQVIGYDKVKERLSKEITFPLRYKNVYKNHNLKPIKGMILTGPPGTGKTTLAKALATQLNHNFIFVSGSELLSKYVGETENKITQLFNKARTAQPCIIFIDEIDSLFGTSRSTDQQSHDISKLGTFLSQMDGVTKNEEQVILIGTTNRIDILDPALLRAGRFELKLTMDYPNRDQLKLLYMYYFQDEIDASSFSWLQLLDLSLRNNLVGADIAALKRIVIAEQLAQLKPSLVTPYQSEHLKITESELIAALNIFLSYKKVQEPTIVHEY